MINFRRMYQQPPRQLGRSFRAESIVLGLGAMLLVLLSFLPLPPVLRLPLGVLLTYLVPGFLFLGFFAASRSLNWIERVALAVVISLSLPYIIAFAFFFVIKFTPETMRVFLTAFLTVEAFMLMIIKTMQPDKPRHITTTTSAGVKTPEVL